MTRPGKKRRGPPLRRVSTSPAASSRAAWRWWLAGAIAVALGMLGWVAARNPPIQREPDLDVLLVTIDTLRADVLGCYGHPGGTSPTIDRLASQGVRFEVAHAHNVLTLPSHANILTGHLPFEHGVRDNKGFRLPRDAETLATRFREMGYRTGAFVSGAPLHSRFGLSRGFDVYDDRFVDRAAADAFVVPERPATETVTAALSWIEGDRSRPYFLWVHVYDPHTPYHPPPTTAARFPDQPYLGEVAATDAALEPLLQPLIDAGPSGRALVVLTADHGESLGEHGELTHGLFAYEATLRVPLILFSPRLLPPRIVRTPARHVDLVPTVLDALGAEIPRDLPGTSLLPAAVGQEIAAPGVTYFEALSSQIVRGWAPLHGVIREGVKYIDLPIPEVYDLEEDPGEAQNLAARRPRELEALAALLSGFQSRGAGPLQIEEDSETLRRLAALGYVGSGSVPEKSVYTPEDDPKNLVELDTLLHRALTLHREGELEAAVELCRELIAQRPTMAVSHALLASLYSDLGRHAEAISAARTALALNPTDAKPAILLAEDLMAAGEADEAIELLAPYADEVNPDLDVLTTLAGALIQVGRPERALEPLERAREIDPTDALLLVKVAAVYLSAGRGEEATLALDRALALDPDLALAHHHLGMVALARGSASEAERHFRRALDSNPDEADTLLNLGMLLAREGRRDEARPLLERFVSIAPRDVFEREISRVGDWLRLVPEAPG